MEKHFYSELEFNKDRKHTPYIALNMVSSLDGKVTSEGTLRPGSLGSVFDRKTMNFIRSHFDAILAGGNTVRQHPYYFGIPEELALKRIEKGLDPQPLTIILTKSGKLDPNVPLFSNPPRPPVIFTSQTGKKNLSSEILKQANVEILDGNTGIISICEILKEKYKINKLLVEGGPSVNYQFLQEKLINEAFLTLAPHLIGASNDLSVVMGDKVLPPCQIDLLSFFRHNQELFLRYRLNWTSKGS